jgi:hypothetical protein
LQILSLNIHRIQRLFSLPFSSIVQALVLLRNRDFLSPLALMPALFQLFKCQDKALRTLVFQHIIGGLNCLRLNINVDASILFFIRYFSSQCQTQEQQAQYLVAELPVLGSARH